MPLSVFANAARLRVVGLLEWVAAANFLVGIFSPSGTPSERCRAPGCFIAPLIQFLAMMIFLCVEGAPEGFPDLVPDLQIQGQDVSGIAS